VGGRFFSWNARPTKYTCKTEKQSHVGLQKYKFRKNIFKQVDFSQSISKIFSQCLSLGVIDALANTPIDSLLSMNVTMFKILVI
jgi:hypothetical protein